MTAAREVQNILLFTLVWIVHYKFCTAEDDQNISTMENIDYSTTYDYDGIETLCTKDAIVQFRSRFFPTFFSIICLLSLVGNLLVILTVFRFKRLKTMTDVYLLHLSFADLLFALFLPFWAANSMVVWKLGVGMCKIIHTVYKVSFYSSMFFLSFISIDRYFAIAKAVSAHRHRSEAVFFSKVSSVVIWVTALIFSIPEMVYANIRNDTCTLFSGEADSLRIGIQASQIGLGFILPLVVMAFCYISIIHTLSQARNFERNKAIRVILAVVAVFLISQVPYNIVLIYSTLNPPSGRETECNQRESRLYATDVTQCLAFLRCCLNPLVYAFIGVKFRNDLLKLLKDFGCLSQQSFYKYTCGRRRSSGLTDTESTTTFSP